MINFDYRTAITLDPVLARKQIIDTYYHKANRNTALISISTVSFEKAKRVYRTARAAHTPAHGKPLIMLKILLFKSLNAPTMGSAALVKVAGLDIRHLLSYQSFF